MKFIDDETLEALEKLTEHETRPTELELDRFIRSLGYRLIPELTEWVAEPARGGHYWISPCIDGRFVAPHIIRVIDYQRPDRGLEVDWDSPRPSIPVKTFLTECYPKSKWLFIPVPELPKTQLGLDKPGKEK